MEHKKRYLGFDLGAESGRCVAGELEAGRLTLHEVHRFATPLLHCMGHYYWDVLAIFVELEKSLTLAAQQFGSHFDGISLDTWGVDYVLLDGDDRLLGYPYTYRDSRTDGMLEKAFQTLPQRDIFEYTGIAFHPINTLYQMLAEKQQRVNLLEIADCFLPMPNYLLFLLCGVKKAEYTIASTTQLANPHTRNWAWPVIELFWFPKRIFPEIVEPGTYLGKLLPELAHKCGLREGIPVIAGPAHDTAAAVAAVPAENSTWAYLSSGTWSLMGVERDAPVITDEAMQFNFTNEGGVANTTRLLKNIIGLWPLQECRRYWREHGQHYSYAELEALAREVGPVRAWLNLEDARFFKPGNMPEKIVSFLHETQQHAQADAGWITRCSLESLAFKYRATLQELEAITAQTIECLHIVGGGAYNQLLCQLTADAIGREVIAGPVEGTIAGNIGMQALATGELADLAALRQMVRDSFEVKTYQPEGRGYWEENKARFRELSLR